MLTLNAIFDDATTAATGNSVQQFAAIVREKLCKPVCSQQTIQPTPSVTYTITSVSTIGTTTFVTIAADGTISYVPKNCSGCKTEVQSFHESTTLIFSNTAATSAPTVQIAQGVSDGALTDFKCLTANAYQIATNVTVTATYA